MVAQDRCCKPYPSHSKLPDEPNCFIKRRKGYEYALFVIGSRVDPHHSLCTDAGRLQCLFPECKQVWRGYLVKSKDVAAAADKFKVGKIIGQHAIRMRPGGEYAAAHNIPADGRRRFSGTHPASDLLHLALKLERSDSRLYCRHPSLFVYFDAPHPVRVDHYAVRENVTVSACAVASDRERQRMAICRLHYPGHFVPRPR
ncbi:MAG: hypothetical protein A4E57_02148 [Syntrophorhabdaceae bacterium PtaU1.Bin034]|nr:MAG: hypothetical protein A4E57_02148 [Syntrophorhabdaceae bacterium PtaU1.Bin034]